ncbi:MAG TPA: hypothetical protein PLR73_13760 [Acetivibrio sp.]|nr:hypothetical protein [Acetivibrio sp.]
MKVLRKREVEVKNIRIGDQIVIPLAGFGEFTATAQKITDKGTLFLFDDCVARQPMNKKRTNEGGFEKSDLKKWIDNILLPAFPDNLRNRIENLTIPTYGQILGHDDRWNDVIEPDNDEQFPLMTKRKNRIADFENDYEWYWLQNATKKELFDADFAIVDFNGIAAYYDASDSFGVRPVFLLVD